MDTKALSTEFRKYDQVAKTHTYRLAEDEADEFDNDYRIATLDFPIFNAAALPGATSASPFWRATASTLSSTRISTTPS